MLVERTTAAEAEFRASSSASYDARFALSKAKKQGASPAVISELQADVDEASKRAAAADDLRDEAYADMGLTLGPLAEAWTQAGGLLYAETGRRNWAGQVRAEILRQGQDLVARMSSRAPKDLAPGGRAWRHAVRWAGKIHLLASMETAHAHMTASCGHARGFAAQMTAMRLRELLHQRRVAATLLGSPLVAAVTRCLEHVGQFPALDSAAAWTYWLDGAQLHALSQRGRAFLQARIEAAEKRPALADETSGAAWWQLVRDLARLHRDLGGGVDYAKAIAPPEAGPQSGPDAATGDQPDDVDGDEVRAWIWAGPAVDYAILGGSFMPHEHQERMERLVKAQRRTALLLARAFAPRPGPHGVLAPVALLDASVRRDLSPHLVRAIAAAPVWNEALLQRDRLLVRGREPFDEAADRAVAGLMQRAIRRYAAAAAGPYQRAFWLALLQRAGVATADERGVLAAHRQLVERLERDAATCDVARRRWMTQPLLAGSPPWPTEAAFALATHGEPPPGLARALAPLRLRTSLRSLVQTAGQGAGAASDERLLPPVDPACELTSSLQVSDVDVWSIEPPWRGQMR